jgi:hypothetical protein
MMKKLIPATLFFFINSGLNCLLYSDAEITSKSSFVLVLSSILFAVFMSVFMKKPEP